MPREDEWLWPSHEHGYIFLTDISDFADDFLLSLNTADSYFIYCDAPAYFLRKTSIVIVDTPARRFLASQREPPIIDWAYFRDIAERAADNDSQYARYFFAAA